VKQPYNEAMDTPRRNRPEGYDANTLLDMLNDWWREAQGDDYPDGEVNGGDCVEFVAWLLAQRQKSGRA
jgi:hypothetical protein